MKLSELIKSLLRIQEDMPEGHDPVVKGETDHDGQTCKFNIQYVQASMTITPTERTSELVLSGTIQAGVGS